MPHSTASDEIAESPRRFGFGLRFWFLIVVGLLGLYIWAYSELLSIGLWWFVPARHGPADFCVVQYSTNERLNRALTIFFRPLQRIDVHIRPNRWKTPLVEIEDVPRIRTKGSL